MKNSPGHASHEAMNDRDKYIITLREQGLSCGAIGAKVGLSLARVADILREHNPALSGAGLASARAEAVVRLRRGRRTYAEIAATLGLSVPAIAHIIAKHSPSLTGRRRGYEPVTGEFDRLRRNMKMLLLRRQGITYRALGQQYGLTASAAQEIVASLERLFTGPQAMRALQSRNALRNLHIIHLRRRRLTYAEIGARVGLSQNAVNYVIESIAPSLTGRELARRDHDAPRSTGERRAEGRRYRHDVVKPGRHLPKASTVEISRRAEAHLVKDLGPRPAAPPIMAAVPIELVQPEANAQNHSQANAAEGELLRRSIQRLGVLAPIVVSSAGNGRYVIIDGHRRYQIAREMGIKSIACVVNPEMDDGSRWGIRLQLESTFKPLTAAEHDRRHHRLHALGA